MTGCLSDRGGAKPRTARLFDLLQRLLDVCDDVGGGLDAYGQSNCRGRNARCAKLLGRETYVRGVERIAHQRFDPAEAWRTLDQSQRVGKSFGFPLAAHQ